jgi:hypothetical protein
VKFALLSSTKSFALSSIVNLWFGHSFDLAVLRQIDMTSTALNLLSKNFGWIYWAAASHLPLTSFLLFFRAILYISFGSNWFTNLF